MPGSSPKKRNSNQNTTPTIVGTTQLDAGASAANDQKAQRSKFDQYAYAPTVAFLKAVRNNTPYALYAALAVTATAVAAAVLLPKVATAVASYKTVNVAAAGVHTVGGNILAHSPQWVVATANFLADKLAYLLTLGGQMHWGQHATSVLAALSNWANQFVNLMLMVQGQYLTQLTAFTAQHAGSFIGTLSTGAAFTVVEVTALFAALDKIANKLLGVTPVAYTCDKVVSGTKTVGTATYNGAKTVGGAVTGVVSSMYKCAKSVCNKGSKATTQNGSANTASADDTAGIPGPACAY